MNKPDQTFPWIWLIVLLSLGLNLYGIDWGLPIAGAQDWANDSVAPVEPLAYAKSMLFRDRWWSKYPPFHFMLLAALDAPYTLYLLLTGGLASPTSFYPYGLKDPALSLTIYTLIARLASVVMGSGTVLVNYYTVKKLYGQRAGLISAFLIATSYALIYYSHNANIDGPQLFWISLALYSYVSILDSYQTKHYLLLGLFTALAVGTKNSAYALFPGVALVLLYFHWRRVRDNQGGFGLLPTLFDRRLLYGLLAFVVVSIIVFNVPFNWQGFVEHVGFHLGRSLKGSKVIRESTSAFEGHLALIGRSFLYLYQANGPAAFFLMVGGFLYCLVRLPSKSWTMIIPMISYYSLFLTIHSIDHLRYILPIYFFFTWQAGKLAADLLEHRKIPPFLSAAVLLVILSHSLVYGFSLDWLMTHDSRYPAEKWIAENIPRQASVAAHGADYALPRFAAGRQITHLPLRKGQLTHPDLASLNTDYLVFHINRRQTLHRSTIYQRLQEQGFFPVASFKSETPVFGADLFHAVNPEIVVFKRSRNSVEHRGNGHLSQIGQ